MSGLMTNKLDHLFKALTENAPITKDLIAEAKQEYTKLRVRFFVIYRRDHMLGVFLLLGVGIYETN